MWDDESVMMWDGRSDRRVKLHVGGVIAGLYDRNPYVLLTIDNRQEIRLSIDDAKRLAAALIERADGWSQ